MPAKVKVTKEMILDAAFAVARETGAENINARTVSERLHCSTQPVMYHFATIEELKRTVYAKADQYHSDYLMRIKKPQKGAALGIGMNYIRFAIEEPHLFRFLFQSDYFNGSTLLELIDAEELTPVLSAMQGVLGIGMEQTKQVFLTVFLFAHGYASIIANNSLKYDEETINSQLQQAYRGAILAAPVRLWMFLLLVAAFWAFIFLTLHFWLEPYSTAYAETRRGAAGVAVNFSQSGIS